MASATTISYNRITRQIKSKVRVFNGLMIAANNNNWEAQEAKTKEYTAVWDTGASSSAITRRVVDELELSVISRGTTHTAADSKETTIHDIHLWLPDHVIITHCAAICVDLNLPDVDLLIGMDVISQGDFSISNYQGNTVMSFRVPSQACIDYVDLINQQNKTLTLSNFWKDF